MNEAASDVYEINTESTSKRKRVKGWIGVLISNFMAMGQGIANPGGRIISVRNKTTGVELFRHIEGFGDDDAALLGDITNDLETMTADEFAQTWVTKQPDAT